ncbi:MAG: ribokinase [Nocardioides sp.]|nr:ribokinase [Nocardioides sp.]
MTHVLVVGESLVDVVQEADGRTTDRPGGSAANVAVALGRLGRPVRFATAWADDEHGRLVADHLSGAGVALAADPLVLERTAVARAVLGADGAATYDFDLAWRLGEVSLAAADGALPAYVHVCSLGAVLEPGADQVLALLDRVREETSATVTYDVNARPAIVGHGPEVVGRVESVVRRAHLVKASDEDLAWLYPTLSVEEAAARLQELGPATVVVTRGGDGLSWYAAGTALDHAAPSVEVVDTIGAGDTVSAALVDALWDGLGPADALVHAARAAAVTVSRPGADPPTRDELG